MPVSIAGSLLALNDFDFVLADRVVRNAEYATSFYSKPVGGLRMLDNGMHEGGQPLVASTLLDIADTLHVDMIIGPDYLDDWSITLERTIQFRSWSRHLTAIVLHTQAGSSDSVLNQLLNAQKCALSAGFNIICIPYRARKNFALNTFEFIEGVWYHFLGLDCMSELDHMKVIAVTNSVSLDTGKPFRLGFDGIDMSVLEGEPWLSGDVQWNATSLTNQQKELIAWNIATVKKRLR